MVTNPDRDSISDRHLRAIGKVILEWQILEAQIEAAVWTLLFVDYWTTSPWLKEREGRAITTHLTTPLRLDMILSLAQTRLHKSLRQSLKDCISRIRPLMAERNTMTHAQWSMTPKGILRQTYKARGKLKPAFDLVSVEGIEALADRIQTESANLDLLIHQIAEHLQLEDSYKKRR
jgi:hypothetical protein